MKRRDIWALALSGLVAVATTAVGQQQPRQPEQPQQGQPPQQRQQPPQQGQQPWGPGMMQAPGAGMQRGAPGMMGAPGAMAGPGRMGPGAMGGYGMGGIWSLDLSEKQRQQIGEIMARQQKRHWELAARMQEGMAQLNRLYAQDTPDPEEVGEAYSSINEAQREMMESRVRAHNSMWELLTDEQRQQLRGYGWGWQQ